MAWLQGAHRVGPGQAARLVGTARALRGHMPATAEAMARSLAPRPGQTSDIDFTNRG